MEYHYLVRYAHFNENAEDIPGGVRQGMGEMNIRTYEPVETQQQRDDVAAVIGRQLHEKYGTTDIAIQAIIAQDEPSQIIEVTDFTSTDIPVDE